MRFFSILVFFLFSEYGHSQVIDSLNTAKDCSYMSAAEKSMIYEINRVRTNPKSYLPYLQPLLNDAKDKIKTLGKGAKSYSVTFTLSVKNGQEIKTVDTTWHYAHEEEVNAITALIRDLTKLKPLKILKPDSGIYNAAKKHADDQNKHQWTLMHTGSDGSAPWDRILKYSPAMSFGNENLAYNSGKQITTRDFVILLLIDEGIPGYGHRYNLLDPHWTHVACREELYNDMHCWIQNFGTIKK